MLDIKKIIFGTEEYSKVPFETRFKIVTNYLNNLTKNNLNNINKDTIKEIIYKIKELLRIKSSNLNKAIRNPNRKITKKDVLNFINFLGGIVKINRDEEIISNTYNSKLSERDNSTNFTTNSRKVDTSDYYISKSSDKINNENNEVVDFKVENKNKKEDVSADINDIEKDIKKSSGNVIGRYNLKKEIFFEGHKIVFKDSYLEIERSVDLSYIKRLLSLIKESIDNFNIIIKNSKTIIVPRLFKDDILELNYELSKNSKDESLNSTFEKLKDSDVKSNEDLSEKGDDVKANNFEKIEKNREKLVKKFEEAKSLDELINNFEEKKEKNDKVLDLSDKEPVEIKTKAERDIELNKEVKDEILDFVPKNRETKIEVEKDEPIKVEEKKILDEIKDKYLIFEDEFIKISLKEKLPLGTIEIILRKDDLEAFNYGFIYSKYLSSLIFQIVKCEGTNIIFKNLKFTIYPRFNNDNVVVLPQKEATPDALLTIFKKLTEKIEEKKEEINDKNINNNEIKIEKKDEKSDVKDRARLILEKLKRIP